MRRENLDPKDHMDPQAPEEGLEQEATLARLVLLDLLVLLVLMANLESRESLVSKARRETLVLQDHRAWPELTDLQAQLVSLD